MEPNNDNVSRTLMWGGTSDLCQFGLLLSPRRQQRPTRVATRLCESTVMSFAITPKLGRIAPYQLVISHALQVPRSSSDTLWRSLYNTTTGGVKQVMQKRLRRSKTHLHPGQKRGHLAAGPRGQTGRRFARHMRLENVQRRGRRACTSSQVVQSRRRLQTPRQGRMA